MFGYGAAALCALLSAVIGVYTEKVMKDGMNVSIHWQNLQVGRAVIDPTAYVVYNCTGLGSRVSWGDRARLLPLIKDLVKFYCIADHRNGLRSYATYDRPPHQRSTIVRRPRSSTALESLRTVWRSTLAIATSATTYSKGSMQGRG